MRTERKCGTNCEPVCEHPFPHFTTVLGPVCGFVGRRPKYMCAICRFSRELQRARLSDGGQYDVKVGRCGSDCDGWVPSWGWGGCQHGGVYGGQFRHGGRRLYAGDESSLSAVNTWHRVARTVLV